eukprot:GHVT01081452.1.p1 GENE.GHVT01081452.1~~GHVT01081452.1.p1  ORF type:complete len:408 (-),score=110.18 GHVT01081452.1:2352-3575(-)
MPPPVHWVCTCGADATGHSTARPRPTAAREATAGKRRDDEVADTDATAVLTSEPKLSYSDTSFSSNSSFSSSSSYSCASSASSSSSSSFHSFSSSSSASSCSSSATDLGALRREMVRFSVFFSQPWWALSPTDAAREAAPRRTANLTDQELRKRRLVESMHWLRAALAPHTVGVESQPWEELWDVHFYASLLGTFDLVNVNVEFDHPLATALARAAAEAKDGCTRSKHTLETIHPLLCVLQSIVSCGDGRPVAVDAGPRVCVGSEEAGSVPPPASSLALAAPLHVSRRSPPGDFGAFFDFSRCFPPFMGVALYRSVALTNHSCWPSAEVDYPFADVTAAVVATRALRAGEEVTQSYIDEELPLEERQRELRQVTRTLAQQKYARTPLQTLENGHALQYSITNYFEFC